MADMITALRGLWLLATGFTDEVSASCAETGQTANKHTPAKRMQVKIFLRLNNRINLLTGQIYR
jgi:hypothetical protein